MCVSGYLILILSFRLKKLNSRSSVACGGGGGDEEIIKKINLRACLYGESRLLEISVPPPLILIKKQKHSVGRKLDCKMVNPPQMEIW